MTTYRDAGVDIDAQDRALEQVKKMVRNTYTSDVLSDQGAFGGLLISSTTASTTFLSRGRGRCSFSTTWPPVASSPMWLPM